MLAAGPASLVRSHVLRKSGDRLSWGCAAGGEQGDKGQCSAAAGLAGLGRRAHTRIRRRPPQAGVYPSRIDRAQRRKAVRPYSIVQLRYAPRNTTRVSALVALEKDTLLCLIGIVAHYSAFRRERYPELIGLERSDVFFSCASVGYGFFFSPPSLSSDRAYTALAL